MPRLTIATRASKLALWQANHVRDTLMAAQPGLEVDLLTVKTTGDKITDRPLAAIGGKALFVKEIEQALLDGRAHIAVHSMKDVPAELAPDTHMAAITKGADPFDALCTKDSRGLDALDQGAVLGTSSLRRACQLLARRPDLEVKSLRGNVPTRLGKLDAGDYDAIVLAAAGLKRLGFEDRISERLGADVCLPAVGQGVLGIQTRMDDDTATKLVRATLHDEADAARVTAERAFLGRLGGSCQTPIAAHAVHADGQLRLDGLVGRPDGSSILRDRRSGAPNDAEAIGVALAEELLGRGADEIIAACQL